MILERLVSKFLEPEKWAVLSICREMVEMLNMLLDVRGEDARVSPAEAFFLSVGKRDGWYGDMMKPEKTLAFHGVGAITANETKQAMELLMEVLVWEQIIVDPKNAVRIRHCLANQDFLRERIFKITQAAIYGMQQLGSNVSQENFSTISSRTFAYTIKNLNDLSNRS